MRQLWPRKPQFWDPTGALREALWGVDHPVEPSQENRTMTDDQTPTEDQHRRHWAHKPVAHIIRDGQFSQLDAALIHIREADPAQPRAMARLTQPLPERPWTLDMFTLPDSTEAWSETEQARWGVVIPERLLDALYDALAKDRGDSTDQARALRTAEDLLEERDTELREAAVELAERTLERNNWETLALTKDETMETLRGHLADVRQALGLERDRTNALTAELFGAREKLERAQSALESLRTPRYVTGDVDAGGWALTGAIHLEDGPTLCGNTWEPTPGTTEDPGPCRLPDDGHLAHSDGVYAWNAGTIQRLGA